MNSIPFHQAAVPPGQHQCLGGGEPPGQQCVEQLLAGLHVPAAGHPGHGSSPLVPGFPPQGVPPMTAIGQHPPGPIHRHE